MSEYRCSNNSSIRILNVTNIKRRTMDSRNLIYNSLRIIRILRISGYSISAQNTQIFKYLNSFRIVECWNSIRGIFESPKCFNNWSPNLDNVCRVQWESFGVFLWSNSFDPDDDLMDSRQLERTKQWRTKNRIFASIQLCLCTIRWRVEHFRYLLRKWFGLGR